MSDNITTPATGTGDATPKVATDQIPGTLEHYQKIKLGDGTADSTTMAVVGSTGLQVASVASSQADGHSATLGSTTDAAATTTGSVIAQLRRIANLLAGTLGISGTVTANAGTGTLAVSAASLPLPSGAATAAKQPALGTAGSPSADVVTVQGSSSGTALPVQGLPGTSGGYSISRVLAAATTNATSAKASAGQVYGWYIFNASAATKYVKLYNKASAPTVGTDTPVMTIPVPAGGGTNVEYENGIQFATGIAYAITGGVADSDATAVAANDVVVNLFYK